MDAVLSREGSAGLEAPGRRPIVGRLTVALAVLVLVGMLGSVPAHGQESLQLTTDYPSVRVQAGNTVDLDLEITAPTAVPVSLEVAEAPGDWTLTFRGGGFVIGGVTATPELPPSVELEIDIPLETPPGDYVVTVAARTATAVAQLDLGIVVQDQPVGGVVLSTEFASLRGRPTDTFQYDLEVTNETPEEITFAFDATGPENWVVTAGPASEQRASTVTVAGGESESVRVEANPPSNAPAGTYDIEVTASGGGQTGSFTLQAEVTGQESIDLVPANGRVDMSGNAGDEASATLVVVNDGTSVLEDVSLTADEPEGWTVEFEPSEVPAVAAGESREVAMRVTPSSGAVAGDYVLGVTARGGGESAELAYRFAVETSRWWGAVGIVIIVAALVVLFVVFRRFGRR